jgi:hypothetical protein
VLLEQRLPRISKLRRIAVLIQDWQDEQAAAAPAE